MATRKRGFRVGKLSRFRRMTAALRKAGARHAHQLPYHKFSGRARHGVRFR